MGKAFDALDDGLITWIGEQHVFFVASAPSEGGHVNLSPKGHDSLRVLSTTEVAYLDLTGSGAETIAHTRENGRLTIMFCAFTGPPQILRLFGQGEAHPVGSPRFEELIPRFELLPGARAIVTLGIERVQTSCGYSIPFMDYRDERPTLQQWAARKGDDGLAAYWADKNVESIDGLPALDPADAARSLGYGRPLGRGGEMVSGRVSSTELGLLRIVDIELTNRCNARCGFCPRDATPHQGLMAPEVLTQSLARVVEVREQAGASWPVCDGISFCGLGDQLLHPEVADYVRRVRAAGLDVAVNTNAALLDAACGERLLAAGVTTVFVNGGEIGPAYDELYGLPFERMRENVARFAVAAEGRGELVIVLVDHQQETARVDEVEAFWRLQGVRRFFRVDLLNRAGSLDLPTMDFDRLPQRHEAEARLAATGLAHGCRAPFAFPFIGYDGQYYLCGSDWQKEVAVGNVFDHSILDVVAPKLGHVRSHDPICRRCDHDPVNRLAALLVEQDAGRATAASVRALEEGLAADALALDAMSERVDELLASAPPGLRAVAAPPPPPGRRRIPVRAV